MSLTALNIPTVSSMNLFGFIWIVPMRINKNRAPEKTGREGPEPESMDQKIRSFPDSGVNSHEFQRVCAEDQTNARIAPMPRDD